MIPSFLRLIRWYYSVPVALGPVVLAAYIRAGQLEPILPELTFACLSLFCLLAAGYILNDIRDMRFDRINQPKRPLVQGRISTLTAVKAMTVFAVLSLTLAALVGMLFLGAVFGVAAFLAVYDLTSKRLGILKDVYAALLMVSLYPLAFAFAEPVSSPRLDSLMISPLWLFLAVVSYELRKDIRDLPGDRTDRSHPLSVSSASMTFLSQMCALAAGLTAAVPYLLNQCHEVYLFSVAGGFLLVMLSLKASHKRAINLLYAHVLIVTLGAAADLLIFGP